MIAFIESPCRVIQGIPAWICLQWQTSPIPLQLYLLVRCFLSFVILLFIWVFLKILYRVDFLFYRKEKKKWKKKNLKGISVIYRMRKKILLRLRFWFWIIFVYFVLINVCENIVTFSYISRLFYFFIIFPSVHMKDTSYSNNSFFVCACMGVCLCVCVRETLQHEAAMFCLICPKVWVCRVF